MINEFFKEKIAEKASKSFNTSFRELRRVAVNSYIDSTRLTDEFDSQDGEIHIFVIQQKRWSIQRQYIVYDSNGHKEYYIKKKFGSIAFPCLRLLSLAGEEIGRVRLRSLTDFGYRRITLNRKKIGSFRKEFSMKPIFHLDLYGWSISSSFTRHSIAVRDVLGHLIVKLNLVQGYGLRYVVELSSQDNKIPALLLWMALDVRHSYKNKLLK